MHYFVPRRCSASSKIMYHDQTSARRAAEESRVQRGVELWVYRCELCGTWHLTSRAPGSEGYASKSTASKPRSRKRGYKPRRR
ncbi:hypothetical protein [Bifidobacterium crudilactis]|uniref:Uncharacterized protein n=1 Tax=Bifidobacterium crudilactis TaxID=327277 RepID=A0A971CY99_9BIFI|nr:hypothetical protein [Bifidobacterium crudilactis]MCI1890418.1 hypothetical protein [Bifidobacterium crudilactis]MDN5972330.1 hypothetical protein [Bifidobacterium crudilactis]MDN6001629.1 hypothetical protein [Bifidobacterium crudilactis]MDN6209737.1 hypothetical protein [Bifidobacterium crudilactis]MDN6233850.1 hypothetical protein [Bifidobacterium crudilactis]